MKIAKIESLHADAGTRDFDFLKLTTDTGLVGWSEYNETFGGPGLSAVIERLAPAVIGKDPRAWEAHVTHMYAVRRQASGGVVQQAIAALENAMLDVKARALGIPVYEMLGGPVRDRIRLYWSHCGTYRVRAHKEMQIPPVRSLDDIVKLGREVVTKGYTALKTNVLLFGDNPRNYAPGFARSAEGFPELNPDRYVIKGIQDQLAAFREGAGPDVDILVDLNFNYKTEGFVKVALAMEPFDLLWVELDTRDPKALQYIRSRAPMPVASCESLFGRRDYRPYFENYSVDVAIIDTPWNGVGESVKIANMADTYEINVAPHNFYGPLATMMSAHFCAVVPNLRIMETDPDTVPWHDDLVTVKPAIKDGYLTLPSGPGWGTEVNEATVRAHPPRQKVIVPRALILSAALLSALLAPPAPLVAGVASAPASAKERAAEVIAALTDYRASLDTLLPLREQELARAIKLRGQRREFLERGIISRKEFEETEAAVASAEDRVGETRRAIAGADQAMAEATTARALAGLPPLGPGGYEQRAGLIRYNGPAAWSLKPDTAKLRQFFAARFGRPLPVSAFGQTPLHDRMGFDHRDALDVAVHPDSPEGRALMDYLRAAGIPFIVAWSAVTGSASGAHIHVGQPSPRISVRR